MLLGNQPLVAITSHRAANQDRYNPIPIPMDDDHVIEKKKLRLILALRF